MEQKAIITIRELCRTYKKSKVAIPAVNNISLDIYEGEFITVTGRSGSGKSTLLNLIGGLDTATSGEINFNGKNLLQMSRNELALYRRFSVGMIFQSFNLIPHMSAGENVEMALKFADHPRSERKKYTHDLLSKVELENRIDHYPSELSGGEAQRVSIARALANKPMVILADEPTGNLDTATSDSIMKILLDLKRDHGKTIIMVTHDREIAAYVSDRIVRLIDGSVSEIINLKQTANHENN